MEEKKISINIEAIKAGLSMASMAVLCMQHFVGFFAANVKVAYIPLAITFMTFFIGNIGNEETKVIKWVSLGAFGLITISGCVKYFLMNYNISIEGNIEALWTKIMFGLIGVISLILSILYVKRIRQLE